MPTFNYGSGRLLGHAEVTPIFASVPAANVDWSDPYSTGALLSDVCRITNFLDDLVDSAFMDMIGAEYSTAATSIGRGTFHGPFFAAITPAMAPAPPAYEVTDADIRSFLQ